MKYYFATVYVEGKTSSHYLTTEDPFDPMMAAYQLSDEVYGGANVIIFFYKEIDPEVGVFYAAKKLVKGILNESR